MADLEEQQAGERPAKKRTSVKVVRRVKSKRSELASPPPPPVGEPAGAPAEEPAARRLSGKRRAQRQNSNVFAMFTQNQVHQFKEAFQFIDQDKDGVISKADIRATFDALGRLCSDRELEEMVGEAPGPINFTMFLRVFGDRVQGTDEEQLVQEAFASFDEGDGFCGAQRLSQMLSTWGDKFTSHECDTILREAPLDARGRVDVRRLAALVTRGADQEEPSAS